ncbi:MAG: hypothetical protein PHV02_08620 [Rhodocyclaceae bacterium]|nr:hypothetical protein [Rhodocyclaceae bacterium]
MIAGSLEIQLQANMARLQKDMDDAKRSVGGAMAQIEKSVAQAKAAMVALGGVMSVGMFTGFVQGAIDAADNLNDLSKSTGIAVEQLAGLKLASKQSGGDLEETAKAINKLSVNIAANAEKYAKIGITAKDPLEAFKQLSDVFNRIDDPQKRAAFGAEALGKSWAGAAPLLSEGSDSIQEMVDKGILLSGATQDAADQADEFNDRLAELETMASSVALGIAQDVMPVLTALAESMVKGKEDTDDLALAFPQLSEVLRTFIVLGGNVAFVLNGVGREIGGIAAQAAAMLRGDFSAAFGAGGIGDMMTADAEKSRAAFDKWEEKMMAAGTTAAATAVKVEESAKKETKAQSDATNEFIKGEDAKKKAADATAKALYNQRLEQMALYQKQAAAELEAITKQQEEYVKALQSALGPLEQQAQNLEREVENYGLSESAIQLNIIARMEEARAIAAANGAWPEHLNYLDQEIELRKRIATAAGQKETLDTNKKAAEVAAKEWEKFADQVEQSLTDALMRSFESGESFGDAFVNNLKNTLKSAALKLAIQTTIGTTGSLANGAINAVLGTSGSNNGGGTDYLGLANNASTAYSLYGVGAQYFTGAATGASAASLAYANGVGYLGGDALGALYAANGGWAGVSTGTGAATSTAAGGAAGGTSLLGAAGYAGLVVAAGMLIGKLVDNGQTEYKGTNLTGTFGDNGFGDGTLSDKWYRDGGWLHTEKDWAVNTPLNASKEMIEANDNLSLGRFRQDIQVPDFSVGDISDPAAEAAARAAAEAAAKPIQDALIATEQERLQSIQTLMDALYTDTKAGMVKVGEAFEDSTFTEKLKAFSFSINESFDTLTLAGVGEKLTEAMGKALLPSVAVVQQTGETWGQTFARMMSETTAVEAVLDMFGQTLAGTFGQDNMDGILMLSDHFVGLFGGIDAMNASFNNYYEKFTPEAEKTARSWEMLERSFTGLGLATPKTRDEFSSLVETLMKSTDFAGQDKLAAVLSLTDAVDKLVPAFEAATVAAEISAETLADRAAWQQRIDLLTGKTTEREIEMQEDLAGVTDTTLISLINYTHALEDQKTAAEAVKVAIESATASMVSLSQSQTGYEGVYGTPESQRALLATQIATAFKSLGLSMPTSEAAYTSLVDSFDTNLGVANNYRDGLIALSASIESWGNQFWDSKNNTTDAAGIAASVGWQQQAASLNLDASAWTSPAAAQTAITAALNAMSPEYAKYTGLLDLADEIKSYFNPTTEPGTDTTTPAIDTNALAAAIATALGQQRTIGYLGMDQDSIAQAEIKRMQGDITTSFADAVAGVDLGSLLDVQSLAAGIDTTTTSGQALLAALSDLAPALYNAAQAASAAAEEAKQAALDAAKTNASDAYAALERAVAAEKKLAQTALETAQEQVSSLTSIFDALKSGIDTLYGNVASTAGMQAAQGAAFISDALATALASGYTPDPDDLGDAISAAMKGTEDTIYASQIDADRAKLVLAGKMLQLKNLAGKQKTVAELALEAAEQQLEDLDDILEAQKKLYDAALGIDTSVKSVAAAIAGLNAALTALSIATKQPVTATTSNGFGGGTISTLNPDGSGFGTGWATPNEAPRTNTGIVMGLNNADYSNAALLLKETSFAKPGDPAYEAIVNDPRFPGFAVGTSRVPYDMLAKVHQDEIIIDPASSNVLRKYGINVQGQGNAELVAEVKALREELIALRRQTDTANQHAKRTADATNGRPEAPVLVEIV